MSKFPEVVQDTKIQHHLKSPDASLDRLKQLAGIITLNEPAPSEDFLARGGEDAEPSARAGD